MIKVTPLGISGALPTPTRSCSSFAITFGGVYLFDCCEGAQKQMMKYGVSYAQVKAIFISHLHADHFLGLFGLVHTLNFIGRKEPLVIYGPKGTKEFLGKVFAMNEFKPHNFAIDVINVDAGKKSFFSNTLFDVKAFKVKHNAPQALGFILESKAYRRFDETKAKKLGVKGRMFGELQAKGKLIVNGKTIKYKDVTYEQKGKKIVYTGDTLGNVASIATAAKEADLLIHDSSFTEEHKDHAKAKTHSTAKQAALNAKKAKVKQLMLTHFSNRYENLDLVLNEAKTEFENTILAQAGVAITV